MNAIEGALVKRTFLYALIASVAISAGLGILAILAGDWGWLEIRVLLTTVTIAAASICGLGCGAYLAVGGKGPVPLAGIALAIAAAALVLIGLWAEIGGEAYWKLAASVCVFGVACAHLSLLSMARLAPSFRWSLVAAYVTILAVATLIVVMILGEPRSDAMFRLLAVAAIFDAAITILVPVFHWLSRSPSGAPVGTPDEPASGGEAVRIQAIDEEIARLKERIAQLEIEKRSA